MAILKDASLTDDRNIAYNVRETFTQLSTDSISEGLGLIADALPNDNLTQWSKDQGQTTYTCQALTFSAMATGLDYAIKYQNKVLDKIAQDMEEHFGNTQSTEFWNVKAESLLERLAVAEHNIDALQEVFAGVCHHYENATGDKWQAYVVPAKATPSASSLDLADALARLKRKSA